MPANPYKVLYFNPSLPVVKFSKMAAKYHNDKELKILERCAELAGFKVLPSSKISWYQRKKHRDSSFRIGSHVYYFIPREIAEKIKVAEDDDMDGG